MKAVENRTPMIGDKVLVKHRTTTNKRGEAVFEAAPAEIFYVKKVLLGGAVIVNSGDLWDVVPDSSGKALWASCDPLAKPNGREKKSKKGVK